MLANLVGETTPNFTCTAVLPNGEIDPEFNLHNAINGTYGLIFFYPLDFTFVCPSELIALHNRSSSLATLNVTTIAISRDSAHTHRAWRKTEPAKGGIGEVSFTMASDVDGTIVENYGIKSAPNESRYDSGVAMRGTFITDTDLIVRSISINDEPIGRSIDEHMRTIQALQFFEEHGQVCPAGWTHGSPGMVNTSTGVSNYLQTHHRTL